MTEDEAIDLVDLFHARVSGWCIALGIDPVTGRTDCRKKRAKESMALLGAILMNSPRWPTLFAAAKRGEDIIDLFPESFRDVLQFQLHHTIPCGNPPDPLSAEGRKHRIEVQGMDDWSASLERYKNPAKVSDHPPISGLFVQKCASQKPERQEGHDKGDGWMDCPAPIVARCRCCPDRRETGRRNVRRGGKWLHCVTSFRIQCRGVACTRQDGRRPGQQSRTEIRMAVVEDRERNPMIEGGMTALRNGPNARKSGRGRGRGAGCSSLSPKKVPGAKV